MGKRYPLPDRTANVLLALTVSMLAVLALVQCGGGGSGGVDANVWYPLERAFPDVATGDINGDGAVDIAFIEKGLYWRLEIEDWGGYDEDQAIFFNLVIFLQDPLAAGSFTKQPSYRLKPEAFSLSLGDLDMDGLVDIALTQKDIDSVGVYLQNPGNPGLFLSRKDFPAGSQPVGVAVGELNGDFINDIAVAGDQLALLINDAVNPGSMFSESSMGFPGLVSIAVADIDGDSRNDMVFTSGDTVTVLFQEQAPAAAGSYTNSDAYTAGAGATEVAIADLNGDSLPDLAVANNENMNGRVSVFFQDPLAIGTFQSPVHFDTDSRAVAVSIGHLNNDALPDMAVANNHEDGGSVAVLIQDPLNSGTFYSAELYPGNLGPDDVAIADLNQDGLADLLVADKVDIFPVDDPERWPYIRYQDASNPGTFLDPVYP